MSGAQIQAEVTAALASLASEVGDGSFAVSIVRPSGAPSQPWEAPTSSTTIPVVANVQMYAQSQIDGTLIQQGDRRVMIAADGPIPTTADKLRIGGKDYSVVNVMPYDPQGIPLYHIVQARV